jgi:hypothetical protein
LPCACGFSTVYAMASFQPDLFSWPRADSFSLCLDFSSVLLLITGKTRQPIFSCATERLVPRRPRDSVSSYLPSRFTAPPGFVFVEQSRSLCGKVKRPGNKPRRPTADLTSPPVPLSRDPGKRLRSVLVSSLQILVCCC